MALLITTQSSEELKKMKTLLFSQYRKVEAKPCSYYIEMKRLEKEIMVAEKLEKFREEREKDRNALRNASHYDHMGE